MSRVSALSVRRAPPSSPRHHHAAHTVAAEDLLHLGRLQYLDAERPCAFGSRGAGAHVDDPRARDAGGVQGEGGFVGFIVIRKSTGRRPTATP